VTWLHITDTNARVDNTGMHSDDQDTIQRIASQGSTIAKLKQSQASSNRQSRCVAVWCDFLRDACVMKEDKTRKHATTGNPVHNLNPRRKRTRIIPSIMTQTS